MGRKDSTGAHSAPVDQYRKQIGKQDWKKSKKELKNSKAKSDKLKSSTAVQDTFLLLGAGLMLIIVLYFGLYVYLNKKEGIS